MPLRFSQLTADLGAGKTRAIVNYTSYGSMAGEKFIFAQPTRDLARQTHNDFRMRWPNTSVHMIHSDTHGNVAKAISDYTQDHTHGGVIICTHTGVIQTPHIHDRQNWHLIVDEMPQTAWSTRIDLKRNRHLITEAMTIEDTPVGRYSLLRPFERSSFENMRDDHAEEGVFSQQIHELTHKLDTADWHLYVLTDQWQKLVNGKGNELLVFGCLSPVAFAGFADTTFASANVEQTLCYQHFKALGCQFTNHKTLAKWLRYEKHPNGDLLDIHYAIAGNWSKQVRDRMIGEESVGKIVADGALRLFGDEDFAKLLNKDQEGKHDPFGDRGVMLPHASHGRNDFQHLHNIACLPALNLTPAFYTFLNDHLGLEPHIVRHAVYVEQVYQAVGRISLRNPDDKNRKKVVVADYAAANYLAQKYPGSSIQLLDDAGKFDGAAPTATSVALSEAAKAGVERQQNADRQRRKRWKDKHSVIFDVTLAPIGVRTYRDAKDGQPVIFQPTFQHPDKADFGFVASYWNSRAAAPRRSQVWEISYDRHLMYQERLTTDQMFTHLADLGQTKEYYEKRDNHLICPSAFDLTRDKAHGHSKTNHVYSQGVMLDLDSTDLSPDEVHQALGYQMAIYSSWSNTPDQPRYRVCIPSLPMSYDAQEAVRRILTRKLAETYQDKQVGMDMSKMTPVSMMYMPCVRPDSFFKVYDGPGLEHSQMVKDCPADIIDKVMSLSLDTPPEPVSGPSEAMPQSDPLTDRHIAGRTQWAIERGTAKWRREGCVKGQGRTKMYALWMFLTENCNMPEQEIKQILGQEAMFASNPTERKQEINNFKRNKYPEGYNIG